MFQTTNQIIYVLLLTDLQCVFNAFMLQLKAVWRKRSQQMLFQDAPCMIYLPLFIIDLHLIIWVILVVPSGKRLHNYGKIHHFIAGQIHYKCFLFNSYVSYVCLPEGKCW